MIKSFLKTEWLRGSKRTSWRLGLVVLIFLISSLGLVFAVHNRYKFLKAEIEFKDRQKFDVAALILQDTLENYVRGLQGMGGVVIASGFQPSSQLMQNYTAFRKQFRNFPGALGFGFIRKVPGKNLRDYVRAQQALRSEFEVKVLAPHTGDHFVIEFISPLNENRKAVGLDVASEIRRREAAQKAMRSGEPVLTAPITLVQSEKKTPGFLFFYPLYRTAAVPQSVEEREKHFVGWAYAPILASSFINSLSVKDYQADEFILSDVTEKSSEVIWEGHVSASNIITYKRKLNAGGRVWLLQGVSGSKAALKELQATSVSLATLGVLLIGVLSFLLNRSLKKGQRTESALASIEAWQDAVLRSANYSLIATDPSGIIQIFNPEAERILGYRAEEMIGKHNPGVFHDLDEVVARTKALREELKIDLEPGFKTFVAKTELTGLPDTNEWTYISKDGSRRDVRLSVMVIRSKEGEIVGYLGVAEDVSELKRLNRLVVEQQGQIINSAKLSALGEMSAGIAHEINNPLAIISSRVEMLLGRIESEKLDSEVAKTELNKVMSTIHRISKIIRGLRTFSRDTSQDAFEDTSVESIVSLTLDLCGERFKKAGVEIELKGDFNRMIHCRQVQISQVLMNLLGNSLDALVDVEPKKLIISCEVSGAELWLGVTDNGPGIAPELQSKILEPFFTTKEVGKGTGLGLSISKGIAEAHKGTLQFESAPGKTTFTLRLPYA